MHFKSKSNTFFKKYSTKYSNEIIAGSSEECQIEYKPEYVRGPGTSNTNW